MELLLLFNKNVTEDLYHDQRRLLINSENSKDTVGKNSLSDSFIIIFDAKIDAKISWKGEQRSYSR